MSEFNVGDYVQHVRQGPGRVVEVRPDQVVIQQRSGHQFRVNLGIAPAELRVMPSDGFVALLYHRELSSESAKDNVADVIKRLARDSGKPFLTFKQLRDAIDPLVKRDGKTWQLWWKAARANVVKGGISVDSKKKIIELSRPSQDEVLSLARQARSASDLLQIARQLTSIGDDTQRRRIAQALAEQLTETARTQRSPSERIQSVLAASYVASYLKPDAIQAVRGVLDGIPASDLRGQTGLEDDILVCMPRFARILPDHAISWLVTLLDHGNLRIAGRAFKLLDSDRSREVLRRRILSWLEAENGTPPLNVGLYLRPDFLRFIRKSDLATLYLRCLEIGTGDASIRAFVNSEFAIREVSGVAEGNRELIRAILASRVLTQPNKDRFGALLHQDAPITETLSNMTDTEKSSAIQAILSGASTAQMAESWSTIRDHLKICSDDVFDALGFRLSTLLDQSTASSAALVLATDALSIAADRHLDAPSLTRAVELAIARTATDGKSPIGSALGEMIESKLAFLRSELETLRNENTQLRVEIETAIGDRDRSRKQVTLLKDAGSADLAEARLNGQRESIVPILLLIDDLERSETADSRSLVTKIENALRIIGVQRLGAVGQDTLFNQGEHELTESLMSGANRVKVLRAGFSLRTDVGSVTLRRALVAPLGEDCRP